MLTKRIRLQLIAFVVIATVAVVYALFRFTDLGKVFGAEGYTARMNLDQSGGIFTNAEVTYRGYNVGRVGEIRLTRDGLQVDLTSSRTRRTSRRTSTRSWPTGRRSASSTWTCGRDTGAGRSCPTSR